MARSRAVKVPTGEPSPFNVPTNTHPKAARSIVEEESESDDSVASDDESDIDHKPIPRSVREDIVKFEESFRDIAKRYRLIDRIGEGKRFLVTGAFAI